MKPLAIELIGPPFCMDCEWWQEEGPWRDLSKICEQPENQVRGCVLWTGMMSSCERFEQRTDR